jgi:hypothetical protein
MVTGVDGDESHLAGVDSLTDPFHQSIIHFSVGGVPPPDENVGIVQHLIRQSLIGIVESGEGYIDILTFGEKLTDCGMNAIGIDSADFFASFFVAVFVPDGHTDHNRSPLACFTSYLL